MTYSYGLKKSIKLKTLNTFCEKNSHEIFLQVNTPIGFGSPNSHAFLFVTGAEKCTTKKITATTAFVCTCNEV